MARVFVSTVLPAAVASVWPWLRNFDGLPGWAPFVRASHIEGGRPPDQPGCVRRIELTDGAVIRERLLALSDYDFSLSYAILDSPMPVQDYVATVALAPVTDRDHSFCSWEADFACHPDDEARLIRHIGREVFAAGLAGLARRLGAV